MLDPLLMIQHDLGDAFSLLVLVVELVLALIDFIIFLALADRASLLAFVIRIFDA